MIRLFKKRKWKNVFKSICCPPYPNFSSDEYAEIKRNLKFCDAQYIVSLTKKDRVIFNCEKLGKDGVSMGFVSIPVCEKTCWQYKACPKCAAANSVEEKINWDLL